MSSRKPILTTLDSVTIERDAEQAVIHYNDPLLSPVQIWIGPAIHGMNDEEILDRYNFVLALHELANRASFLVEIPPPGPQISYDEDLSRWVCRGDVLRCLISDEDFTGQPTIRVDGKDLSFAQFADLLTTYAGWGMRVAFVPEDELLQKPRIILCDPPDAVPPEDNGQVIEFPRPSDSPLDEVLAGFLREKKRQHSVTTFSKYERFISLLREYMDEQGLAILSGGEKALFTRDQRSDGTRFSGMFGPEKIVQVMDAFLADLVRRGFHRKMSLRRAFTTVTRQLLRWLVEGGYISEEAGRLGTQHCGEAVKLFHRIDSAFDLLTGVVERVDEAGAVLDGQYCVARVDHGIIWLSRLGEDGTPVAVPVDSELSQNLEEKAWVVDCTLARSAGRWVITELKDVYPL